MRQTVMDDYNNRSRCDWCKQGEGKHEVDGCFGRVFLICDECDEIRKNDARKTFYNLGRISMDPFKSSFYTDHDTYTGGEFDERD